MTKPKFRFEKPIVKSKIEPVSKNVLWYFSLQKKGLTINTIKEYVKALGWVDLFDTAPIELEEATFTENGVYENNEKGWDKVIVDVPITELTSTTFTSNGLYTNPNGGWNEVNVDIPLNSITITENGSYNASEGGWNNIIVNVPLNEAGNGYIIPYASVDSNIVTPENGDGFNAVIINNTYDKGFGIITFDGPVISIGYRAFYSCSSLTSIIIPNSVTSIGDDAFEGCTSLTSVNIPNSVTSVKKDAFRSCQSLTSIVIPDSVASIENFAFSDCTSLTSIVVETGNTTYDSRDNCNAIIEIATNTLVIGCKNTIIPNSVTSIGDRAFYSCSSLTFVSIGTSVNNVGYEAFSLCSSLTSITIPNSVTSIGEKAFYACHNLASIECKAVTPPTLNSYNNLPNVTAVYVPAESVDAYKTATNWSYYSSIIQPIPES